MDTQQPTTPAATCDDQQRLAPAGLLGADKQLPCPFCGCTGVWRVKEDDGSAAWLECYVCHARGPRVELEGMAEPYWNRRKHESRDALRLDWLDGNMREDAMTHDYVVIRPVQKWQTLRSAIEAELTAPTAVGSGDLLGANVKFMKAKMKQQTDNRHAETSRKVWEYTITGDTFFNCDKLKLLNAHGKDGWEAVCQIGNGNILMKRIAPNV